MAEAFSTSSQVSDEYSPIETLALRALRRYGDMAPSTKDAETILMFMDYGNAILDDIMEHPYWDKGVELPYYVHVSQRRGVPDTLMLAGLLAKYSIDQSSTKAKVYEADYFKRMNQVLTRRKFGVGATFEMQAVDYQDPTQEIPGVS